MEDSFLNQLGETKSPIPDREGEEVARGSRGAKGGETGDSVLAAGPITAAGPKARVRDGPRLSDRVLAAGPIRAAGPKARVRDGLRLSDPW
eukprot:168685-Amphidinium_carterae.1